MKYGKTFSRTVPGLLAVLSTALIIRSAGAVTFDLAAGSYEKTLPDMVTVEMWGYALSGDSYSSPGPVLTVPPGDSTLTINLTNNLTVPTSLVIPGLPAGLNPVFHPAGSPYEGRVRSLTTETMPGDTVSYTWTNVRPGTFLYHSGTQMQIQVQMGLSGAVRQDFSPGQAYSDPATQYQNEVVLVFSEIDTVIHDAVRDGNYGPDGTVTSAVDYWPAYFLINGESFQTGQAPLPAGNVNQKTLVRFLNAGLKTHIPVFHNYYVSILADDGNLLPYHRQQYEVSLFAGKTQDVILTPISSGTITIYDRMLDLTTGILSPGGMMIKLAVAPAKSPAGTSETTITDRPSKPAKKYRLGH